MSKYPNAPDNDATLPRVDDNLSEVGGEAINALRDAVLALERAVGLSPQGNVSDFVTRVNRVIDANGSIKTSALAGKGLVTLPIYDSEVANDAAIKESKLDLDYSTASLNADIATIASDVSATNTAHGLLANSYLDHVLGVADKHQASDIVVNPAVRTETDVQAALEAVDAELVAHEADTTAHTAANVPVLNEFWHISATNVQDALFELDVAGSGAVSTHHLDEHETGVGLSSRAEVSNYGNLKETTLAASVYETNPLHTADVLRVMRPNVARVTGVAIDFQGLAVGASDQLKVLAGGVSRSAITIDLSSAIPTSSVDDLVTAINEAVYATNYPLAAYNTGGRLTLAHTIPGFGRTIEVQTVTNSAATALGFGDVVGVTVDWADSECCAFVAGHKITDFTPVLKRSVVHAASSATIETGVDLSAFGISGNTGRVLFNLTNHTADSTYNGTYCIVSLPTVSRVTVGRSVPAGTFDLELVLDSVAFDNAAAGEVWDVFVEHDLDGYGRLVKDVRATYNTIAGVSLSSINESFPTTSVEWDVTAAGILSILEGGLAGESVTIAPGFTGQVQARSYSGTGWATFEVAGNPGTSTETITVYPFAGSYDRLYVCSVHYAGNFGVSQLKYVTDKRRLGTATDNYTYNPFEKTELEQATNDLRNNGVVYGFELLDSTTTSITIAGGRAYVSGRRLDVPTKTVNVTDFTAPSGLVLLDVGGNLVVRGASEPGYTFQELTTGDAYGDALQVATILEFGATGSALSGVFSDRRLMIGNLDKRVLNETTNIHSRIDTLQSAIGGALWGVTVSYYDTLSGSITRTLNPSLAHLDGLLNTGFTVGSPINTDRRFEITNAAKAGVFKALGTTHINVLLELEYSDETGTKPFGTSGDVQFQVGVRITTGAVVYEDYVTVKEIDSIILPANSVTERYVVSLPFTSLHSADPLMFDVVPAIKVLNSTKVTGRGQVGDGIAPKLTIKDVRVVVSSYSVAGVMNSDTTNESQMSYIGNIL
jgi:hypothetical protein